MPISTNSSELALYRPDDVKNVIVGDDFFELIDAINLGVSLSLKPKTLLMQQYLPTRYEHQTNPNVKCKEILSNALVAKLLLGYKDESALKKIEELKANNLLQYGYSGLTEKNLSDLLKTQQSFIHHIFKTCNDKQIIEEVLANINDISWEKVLDYLRRIAKYHGAVIDPLVNVSNVKNDICRAYKNADVIINSLEICQKPNDDEVNTVIVGAGPIGLLNAIGLLNKNKGMKLVILEKYDEYKRNHTLMVDYIQIQKFLDASGNPPDPAIQELVNRTKKSKYIRISEIEHLLKNRAVELGAHLITGKGVNDVNLEILDKYKNADLIIGADGTRSVVSQQAIGDIDKYQLAPMTSSISFEKDTIYIGVNHEGRSNIQCKRLMTRKLKILQLKLMRQKRCLIC